MRVHKTNGHGSTSSGSITQVVLQHAAILVEITRIVIVRSLECMAGLG